MSFQGSNWAALLALGACLCIGTRATPARADTSVSGIELTENVSVGALDLPTETSTPGWLELGASSWSPSAFSLPSRITAESPFSRTGTPELFADYLLPIRRQRSALVARFGAGLLPLKRNGTIALGGASATVTQNVLLVATKLGLEFTPAWLNGDHHALVPYVGAALLPSFAVTGRSSFDDGSVYFGMPVSLSLGSRIRARSIALPIELDLALSETIGSVDHSSVSGLGVSGGMRISL